MSREVFGRGADWDSTLKDLETDVCPFTDRFEVDATVDKGLREVASAGAKSVGTDSNRSRDLISFEKLDCLRDTVRDLYACIWKGGYSPQKRGRAEIASRQGTRCSRNN